MKILIITPDVPFPKYKNGRATTILSIIEHWAKHHEIILHSEEEFNDESLRHFDNIGVTCLKCQDSPSKKSFLLDIKHLFRPRNTYSYSYFLNKNIVLRNQDLIILVGFESVFYIDTINSISPTSPIVFFEIDCLSLLYKQYYLASRISFKKLYYLSQYLLVAKFEELYYSKVSKVMFVSSADRLHCQSQSHKNSVNKFASINNGVDLTNAVWKNDLQSKMINVCFSGNFAYEPNRVAANFILDEILPCSFNLLPNIVFHFVGINPSDELLRAKQIYPSQLIVSGYVPDIEDYISGMDIYISPLFLGTGMKNKILQAMNIGIPIICSSISVDGICEMEDSSTCLILDSKNGKSWVDSIQSLYKDEHKCSAFSINSMSIISRSYRWDLISEKFLKLTEV